MVVIEQSLSAALGERVRQGRQSRGLTLDQLAEAAGVSRRILVTVEQGASNPSMSTLVRISDALRIGLPALVEPPSSPKAVRVTPAGTGSVLWTSPAGGRGVLLASTEPPSVVELWDWTLGGQDRYVSRAHPAGTRELVLVEQGRVDIEAGSETVTLEVGDAVAFPGDVEHAYVNPDRRPSRFVLSVLEAGVSPNPLRTQVLR